MRPMQLPHVMFSTMSEIVFGHSLADATAARPVGAGSVRV